MTLGIDNSRSVSHGFPLIILTSSSLLYERLNCHHQVCSVFSYDASHLETLDREP